MCSGSFTHSVSGGMIRVSGASLVIADVRYRANGKQPHLSMTIKGRDGSSVFEKAKGRKGKILVLGGSGFLGGNIARRAVLEGYGVTSLSRSGKPQSSASSSSRGRDGRKRQRQLQHNDYDGIDYRKGDAKKSGIVEGILEEGGYVAVFHCIGLLFDGESGNTLRSLNKFVSGSGSIPEPSSTYDDITRVTAFHAISAAEKYSFKRMSETEDSDIQPLPFIFTSAAEAGWPDVSGGSFVERTIAPRWLKRYLAAKRAVEDRLMNGENGSGRRQQKLLRPVILRPSLIYSLDRVASLPPMGAFFVGNRVGLPFVDRPVSVQTLSTAAVRSISSTQVRGVLRFKEIDRLSK